MSNSWLEILFPFGMNTRAHYKMNKIIFLIVLSCPQPQNCLTLLWLTDMLHFVNLAEQTDQE